MTLGRYVCNAKLLVLWSELDVLARAAGLGEPTVKAMDNQTFQMRCTLETHDGPHAEMVYEGDDGFACWVHWLDDQRPHQLRWLPDCPSGDGCCQYLRHPGGHTWEITDVELEMVWAIAPTLDELL